MMAILNSNSLGSLPTYGLMLVSVLVLSFLAMKIFLLAKAASSGKKSREWVFTQQLDEDGMPMLATEKVRSPRMPVSRPR